MSDNTELGTVVICQGLPRCGLVDDEAMAAQQAGCIWCERQTLYADGTERRSGPPIDAAH